ncbi:MAG: NADH:ubiquinone reductase (Na(+)-transporting) subunit A, partial [Reinekea sp.]|nr:NADH:ubiquinone reductase (Na(+)-transporting) subunit A [Reinekea sp.]
MITIKKGLDLPITGAPRQEIADGRTVNTVALIGYDYHGMKPTMLVREGETVKKGQPVFSDKKNEGVIYTAPASGVVTAINRGKRRVFQSLVIEKQGSESITFKKHTIEELANLSGDAVAAQMVESGMWTALRTRPYSKVPAIGTQPSSIFVQAMD